MCFTRKNIASILVLWSLDILHCQASSKSGDSGPGFTVETMVIFDSHAQQRLTERNIGTTQYFIYLFEQVNEILAQLEPPGRMKSKAFVLSTAEEEKVYSVQSGDTVLGAGTIMKLAAYIKRIYSSGKKERLGDMALLVTGRKMLSKASGRPIGGVTPVGSACGKNNVMIVVYRGNELATAMATAHELGHALGSYHDGDKGSKNCPSSDQYLMAPSNEGDRAPMFSTCSKAAIKKFVQNPKASCLYEELDPR